jgi:hypothetical protein
MLSQDEFIDYIDNMIPSEVQEALKSETESCVQWLDLVHVQEKARVLTIKHKLSSTHKWTKAQVVDSNGHRSEVFWCGVCNIRCSVFDHINCLAIISKVTNNLPSYTVHNAYLMHTCNEVMNKIRPGYEDRSCFDCGMPENGKTGKCLLEDI